MRHFFDARFQAFLVEIDGSNWPTTALSLPDAMIAMVREYGSIDAFQAARKKYQEDCGGVLEYTVINMPQEVHS